ncbi:hypothetical protein [Paenibacillus tundrae]|uniref:Undecaprenyl phosphate-alpha-L-ara4N flippase subunit ArnF n=1 Tax=Paenibacillus tundrae TaxID=528187 RepID=A0ABT9WEX7_9BACL|nr:hypothetical protein [Paenibacillus tundrae]MDQ0171792.1 undecaprenyl phosphate-alpha-L-ara4N flippase subunit ArnF [Paenibacillus tundrae]
MKNSTIATWLFLFNGLYLLTLLAYPIVLMMSVFMFDAPTSYDYASNYAAVSLLMSYPIAVLGSLSCWGFYHKRKYKWAIAMANLLLVWIALFILALIVNSILPF